MPLTVGEDVKQPLDVNDPEPVFVTVPQPLLVVDAVAQMLTVSVTLLLCEIVIVPLLEEEAVPKIDTDEVPHALKELLPVGDAVGQADVLKLPDGLILTEPVLLLLCVSVADEHNVLLEQRLCV